MKKFLTLFAVAIFVPSVHAQTTGSIGNATASEDPHYFNASSNPSNYVNPSDDFHQNNDINYQEGTRRDVNRDMKTNTKVNELEELDIQTNTGLVKEAGNLQMHPLNRQHESREPYGNLQHDDRNHP